MSPRRHHSELRRSHADRFLVDAAGILASSLEYDKTLAALCQLVVRSMADFCIIDVVEGGELRRLHGLHAQPEQALATAELLAYPPGPGRSHVSLDVLQSGKSRLIRDVTDSLLESVAQSPSHLAALRSLRPRSLMAVPLFVHGQVAAVILCASATRKYEEADLRLAERLAFIAGLEVDNARHYREAREALLARDRVLGIVAHDLRNPLSTIIMSAGLLREVPADGGARAADAIMRSAQRMNRLIQDLLDVARIEANRLELQLELEDPCSLVAEAVELCAGAAVAKSVRLMTGPCQTSQLIRVDRERLLRVFTNLIDNAVRFTPEGGSIAVNATDEGAAVRFSIADSGTGIPTEDIPNLFQPFWQARRKGGDGAGLGLAIARGLVEAHAGTIWAESVAGKGSVFHFTIPAAAVEVYADRSGTRAGRGTSDAETGAAATEAVADTAMFS